MISKGALCVRAGALDEVHDFLKRPHLALVELPVRQTLEFRRPV